MKKNVLILTNLMILVFFMLSILRGYAQTLEDEKPQDAAQSGIDSVWRSSDLEGEIPVLRQQRKAQRMDGSASLPEGSERVGCICMDYFVSQRIGQGACGGHNGVRFWLYELPSGDTVQIPTLRHEAHPDTLDDGALVQLAAFKRYERLAAQRQLDFYNTLEEHPEWLDGFLGDRLKETTGATPPPHYQRDTMVMPMPFSPVDHAAENTLLYSISVFLGSGALFVIKKIIEGIRGKTESEIESDRPDELI
jgi:hypothetical protein